MGRILKDGLHIAGRHFEFLAYSNSALRSHAVWFVQEFEHHTRPYINAHVIRNNLGDFSRVIHQPSKYAARIAQAFTATDPSITIKRSQWEEIPDLGVEPYLFTDGVGTISPKLGDMIWDALCNDREESYRMRVQPSAVSADLLLSHKSLSSDLRALSTRSVFSVSLSKIPYVAKLRIPKVTKALSVSITS